MGIARAGRQKDYRETGVEDKLQGRLLLCASKNPKSSISGKAFATANLVEIRPMVKADEEKACCKVYDGAYAWILSDIKPVAPFGVKGQLGLFNIDCKETQKSWGSAKRRSLPKKRIALHTLLQDNLTSFYPRHTPSHKMDYSQNLCKLLVQSLYANSPEREGYMAVPNVSQLLIYIKLCICN